MSEPSSPPAPPLEPGAEAAMTVVVDEDMTASHVGSGAVAVLATPQLVALVERVAVALLDAALPGGTTSVGASVAIDHLAPTPPGAEVTATVRVEQIEGHAVRFSFVASDPAGEVARGSHVRVLVDRASFEQRALGRTQGTHPGPDDPVR